MNKRDRRDHPPAPELIKGKYVCRDCWMPVRVVYHRPSGRDYWRHVRRPR